ncbi:LysR family transcriptional regulator [Ewingella americana]
MYREIEIFRSVMLTGSTSRAAEKLNISQPAVSQAIRKLEEGACLKLFARVRGRLLPSARSHCADGRRRPAFYRHGGHCPSPALAERAGAGTTQYCGLSGAG